MQKPLKTGLILFIFCLWQQVNAQTKIVLKLDDIGAKNGSCKAMPVMEYLLQRKVKASYGVIANRLDETAKDVLSPIIKAKDSLGNPMVEIWNHGLDHSRTGDVFEFKNAPYEVQKSHFDSAHTLVKKYLGIEMSSFGAPYNATDSICLRVIAEHGSYKTLMFSRTEVSFTEPFIRLNNNVAMEKETGKPDFAYFMEQYNKHPEYRGTNMVLQGHPPYWTPEGFAEFKKVLDFLDSEKCRYVLPSEL